MSRRIGIDMRSLYAEAAKLQVEQEREELEKARVGMPGAIKRNGRWSRVRQDDIDHIIAHKIRH